ncbi:DUF2663 family protein [Sporolactobacillus nakayamae]|uniref:DUF2663 family protein n=1 Tax=Sporolactobacillus nakayamae TaxID=269670 RepID=A0A1I2MTX2_9BACL|nr:DUF2663 family protein [Sporolactobacillus nakayamae]SFF95025.1 Protein of unknown function [Sporolactobacillus nakayamae]
MSLQEYRDKGQISGITFTILSELIKRKKEKDKWNGRETAAGLALIICVGIIVSYVFFSHPGMLGSMHDLKALIGRPLSLAYVALCVALILLFTYCHGEREDAEDDYDELREEIIERTDELWMNDEPDTNGDTDRFHILSLLKKKFDINLFYK